MSKNVVFTVLINGVKVFNSDNDVQALGFALSLHQTSNVEHEISVVSDVSSVAYLVTPGYLDKDNKSCDN